eukprot:TRINITY_DN218_c0_g1_i2.p1 TRINITY_DN218_c0_g1~~TRINITY_DN218_c0_g1_i2.p1  ORF type:complete len:241 (-),score=51.73 TRINITY_DN218_c0_g1_i2:191-913(-)
MQIPIYDNIEVEWVSGATPTAYLYDDQGNTLNELTLTDTTLDELFDLLRSHGFTPILPNIIYPDHPDATAVFGDHHYDLYVTPNYLFNAQERAVVSTYDDKQGYVVTLSTPDETAFLRSFLSEHNVPHVWIGAKDESETEWKWITGPESGQQFWEGYDTGRSTCPSGVTWRSGEPNNADDDEDCAILHASDAACNDVRCMLEKSALVVEYGDTSLEGVVFEDPAPPPSSLPVEGEEKTDL